MPHKTIQSPVATTQEHLVTQQLRQLEERLALLEAENQQLRSIDPNAPDAPSADISPVQTPNSMSREDNATHRTSQNSNTLFTPNYQTLDESNNDNCVDDCCDLIMCTAGCCEIMGACIDCIGIISSCVR